MWENMMKRFLKSVVYALTGIRSTFRSEQTFRIHVVATLTAILMGLYLKLSMVAWGFVILSIGLVLAAELFNTAVERLGDEVADGKQKQMVGKSKDIAAAAVLISALAALVIGILFLFIPFIQRIIELL
jgi:diacylglycerol kinase